MGAMKVLIVDDHLAFAEAVGVRVGAEPDIEVVGCATTGIQAEHVAREQEPDIALVDVGLGVENGLELVARLRSSQPDLRVVVITCHDDAETACAAINSGASGFVTKDAEPAELLEAIRRVHRDESWIPPRLLTGVLRGLKKSSRDLTSDEVLISGLSPREREVLALMVSGLDRAGIARRLFLSTNTVRTHTQNVLAKLGVHSSLEAVSVALRGGLRPPETTDAQTS